MSDEHIRFSTDILRRLGEELNPGTDQSILELVKNAYDADALNCIVELVRTDHPGGTVIVTDDGDGMNAEQIRDGWLVLGRSGKANVKRTRLNRVPAGNKGLGRLAAIRMGRYVRLVTKPRDEANKQYSIDLDWDLYDRAAIVEDVSLSIEARERSSGIAPGTVVEIRQVRDRIGRMDVKRLARALILLADPFGTDPSAFKPRLVAPEFADLEQLVSKRYFDEAEFHLVASVDRQGLATAKVVDWRGEVLFEADHADIRGDDSMEPYGSPPASFDLWVFLLSQTAFSVRPVSVQEVRDWLKEFGGVHLYENGLRVAPYGNPGNDWLDMNLQRARSPEERPSTNTAIGKVSVDDSSQLLIQKTDRSGFIESETFLELRQFAQDSLDWMARRRLDMAEQRRMNERESAPKKSEQSRQSVVNSIRDLPETARHNVERAFNAYDRAREKEVRGLEREVQLYRTLSTAGITAATFAHESSGNPIKVIDQSIRAIERRASEAMGSDFSSVSNPIAAVKRAVQSLSVLGTATLRLLEFHKRRPGRVEVHSVITGLLDTYRPFLVGRDVNVNLSLAPRQPFLRASEAAVESIFTNLINNSLTAFEQVSLTAREIHIDTVLEDNQLIVRYSDNGPGISGISLKDMWLPGQTTSKNGTGLGLAIVRDAVRDLGGNVSAQAQGSLGGAEFTIELPILGGD
jgi:signal transduction histidine kinase